MATPLALSQNSLSLPSEAEDNGMRAAKKNTLVIPS